MSLVQHAQEELKIAGLLDKGSDYGGMLGEAALEIVGVFAKQGHSGVSAGMVTDIVAKLMRYEPLTPLRGTDDEWVEVGPGVFQNRRCSHVFRENGVAYDIDGKIFREPSGNCYTSQKSRVNVTFPYTPKREYVDVAVVP